MPLCPRCAALFTLPFQRPDFALQGALVDVSADAVIDLHHRSQRALPEARHRAHREPAVLSGQREFVCLSRSILIVQAQSKLQTESLQQIARVPRVASRAPADADGVVALRL